MRLLLFVAGTAGRSWRGMTGLACVNGLPSSALPALALSVRRKEVGCGNLHRRFHGQCPVNRIRPCA